MNPFQKLRKAVDKCTLNYQISQQPKSNNNISNQNRATNSDRKTKQNYENQKQAPTFGVKTENINNILIDQQTKYIQEINQISKKNQRLLRSLKMAQIQKEQLIQQVCILEKNNQILEDRIKQMYGSQGGLEDKQRKYKQEIHRINKTVEQLGVQLTNQRNTKKAATNQLNRYKQQHERISAQKNAQIQKLLIKIRKLEQQITQRSEMLEYNIKKNSEQRRQSKIYLQKMRAQSDNKVYQYNQVISKLKDQLSAYKSGYDVLNHKFETVSSQYENLQHKHSSIQKQLRDAGERQRQLLHDLQQAEQNISILSSEVNKLREQLRVEKQNIKVKIVEMKDQTLQLELEMYRKQCKDLLQERAIYQKTGLTSRNS